MLADEALAVTRLKQWSYDRDQLRHARTVELSGRFIGTGRAQRRVCSYDARLVRVLDFERAFFRLTDEEQAVLVLIYREGQPREAVAAILGWSIRKIAYFLPQARQRLAQILDRLDLL